MSEYPDYIVGDVYVVTALIGGCAKAGDEWILPEGKTLPSQEEIDAKRKELQADYDAKKYQRDRLAEYPSIQELVVALYDADDKAEIDKKRAEIKKKYPKPE